MKDINMITKHKKLVLLITVCVLYVSFHDVFLPRSVVRTVQSATGGMVALLIVLAIGHYNVTYGIVAGLFFLFTVCMTGRSSLEHLDMDKQFMLEDAIAAEFNARDKTSDKQLSFNELYHEEPDSNFTDKEKKNIHEKHSDLKDVINWVSGKGDKPDIKKSLPEPTVPIHTHAYMSKVGPHTHSDIVGIAKQAFQKQKDSYASMQSQGQTQKTALTQALAQAQALAPAQAQAQAQALAYTPTSGVVGTTAAPMTTAPTTTATVITDTCENSEWAKDAPSHGRGQGCPSTVFTHTTPIISWYDAHDSCVIPGGCGPMGWSDCMGKKQWNQTTTWRQRVFMLPSEYNQKKNLPCSGSTTGRCTEDYCCTKPVLADATERTGKALGGVKLESVDYCVSSDGTPGMGDYNFLGCDGTNENGWMLTDVAEEDGSTPDGGAARCVENSV